MRRTFLIHLIVVALATFTGSYSIAEDSNEELVKKDHKLIEGTWKVVALEVNGNKSSDEDVRKITVINGADGTWSIHSEGKEIIKGTSIIYPTQKPKTIDFPFSTRLNFDSITFFLDLLAIFVFIVAL